MALIVPQGKLTVTHPAGWGIVTSFGLSRDWRPNARWETRLAEWIEPLGAIGPAGDMRPVAMGAAAWTASGSYSSKYRWVTVPGDPPVSWLEFYDGTAYAGATAPTTWGSYFSTAASWQPNWVLRLVRQTAPPGQGITPQVSIGMPCQLKASYDSGTSTYYLDRDNGVWTAGIVSLILPFASDTYRTPVLHAGVGSGPFTIPGDGFILSEGPQTRSTDDGEQRETWSFEVVQDQNATEESRLFPGAHVLIRSTAGGDWWHCYHECLRISAGTMTLFVGGAKQALNLTPIAYCDAGTTEVSYAWPREWLGLPGGNWTAAATWGTLNTPATNWTVACTGATGVSTGLRPYVSMTCGNASARFTRPVVWLVTEDHAAVIEDIASYSPEDTDGDHVLKAATWTLNKSWQGAQGSAEFYPRTDGAAPYTGWRERSIATLNMGWQTGAGTGLAAQDVGVAFIMPGGLARKRDGEEYVGTPQLPTVALGDFIAAKLEQTCVVDFRQAGGRTVGAWFAAVCNRLGLTSSYYDIDAGVSATVIPCYDVPSRPNLAPQDGQSWSQHLTEVCKSLGLRWGWDPIGKLFIDAGAPAWVIGATANFTIDEDTTTVQDHIRSIEAQRQSSQYRNCVKALYGPESLRREGYYGRVEADRVEDGGDLWDVVDARDSNNVAQAFRDHWREHGITEEIVWTGPLRPALLPDHFVLIGDLSGLEVTEGDVYQIIEHEMRMDAEANTATSTIRAVRVYEVGSEQNQPGLNAGSVGGVALGSIAF